MALRVAASDVDGLRRELPWHREPVSADRASGSGRAEESVGSTPAHDKSLQQLIKAAQSWMQAALGAWADDDYDKMAVFAPLGVEHLGKAVLWHINPVLLIPLRDNAERSLMALALRPDLSDSKLRTIGLETVLKRLDLLLERPLLGRQEAARLVEVRNGAIHVGTSPASRVILADALTACASLMERIGLKPHTFYGAHTLNAEKLLDEKQSEIGLRVAAKLAKARRFLTQLEDGLGPEMFRETTDYLEAETRVKLTPDMYGAVDARPAACPECGSSARLFGELDVEDDVDWDVEPLGGGQYISLPYGVSSYYFSPSDFACNVCQLSLHGWQELREGGLEFTRHEVSPSDMDEDFDPDLYTLQRFEP